MISVMGEIRKIICPSCNKVLTIGYVEGLENKSFACPVCKVKHKFTEYRPYQEKKSDDETELGDVLRYRAANKQASVQTDETGLGSGNQAIILGSLILPGITRPVPLKEGRNIIGRAASTSTATIQVNDPSGTMSRSHYYIDVLVYENTVRHLLSIDPNAKNSTALNGVKFEKTDKLVLHDGDRIRSGQVEVEFVLK